MVIRLIKQKWVFVLVDLAGSTGAIPLLCQKQTAADAYFVSPSDSVLTITCSFQDEPSPVASLTPFQVCLSIMKLNLLVSLTILSNLSTSSYLDPLLLQQEYENDLAANGVASTAPQQRILIPRDYEEEDDDDYDEELETAEAINYDGEELETAEAINYDDEELETAEATNYDNEETGEISMQQINVPVKGPVPESEQYYDKYGRKIVYEVDMDEVDALLDQYLMMGKDKFNAYLAKSGSNHFLDFISKLKQKIKKHKESDDCDSEHEELVKEEPVKEEPCDDPYKVPDGLDDDKVCEFVKFKNLLLETLKEWDEEDIDKMVASLASFDFTEDPYCENSENEEECSDLKAIKVKSQGQKEWLEENARRRLELLSEVLNSPDGIDYDTIAESEEFQYRQHNIFLEQDDNEFINVGTTFVSPYKLLLTAVASVLSLI